MVEVYVQQKTCIKCLVVVWLWLLFKVLFTWKCIKIIYFYFLKIIFDINASKWSKRTKKILIWSKEKNKIKIQFFLKALLKLKNKQCFTKLS